MKGFNIIRQDYTHRCGGTYALRASPTLQDNLNCRVGLGRNVRMSHHHVMQNVRMSYRHIMHNTRISHHITHNARISTHWVIIIWVFVIGISACTPSSPTPQPEITPEITPSVITENLAPDGARLLMSAEQAESPVIAWMNEAILVTWIGTDSLDVRHFAQWKFDDVWQPVQALSLLTNRPHAQQLVVTTDNIPYLLWLDALPAFPEPQLVWFAPISEDYGINPGALPLSNIETSEFTAIADSMGGIWVVWRGGLIAEPTLYAQQIDSLGRPRFTTAIIENGTHPVLIADSNANTWLFWLSEGVLWRGRWDAGAISDNTPLGLSVGLGAGDLLESFKIGIAGDEAFAFWQVSRSDGSYESYWAHGSLTGATWGANLPIRHDATWLTPNQLMNDDLFAVGIMMNPSPELRIYQWTGSDWWAKREGIQIPSGLFRPPTWLRQNDESAILAWSQPNGLSANLWLWGAD